MIIYIVECGPLKYLFLSPTCSKQYHVHLWAYKQLNTLHEIFHWMHSCLVVWCSFSSLVLSPQKNGFSDPLISLDTFFFNSISDKFNRWFLLVLCHFFTIFPFWVFPSFFRCEVAIKFIWLWYIPVFPFNIFFQGLQLLLFLFSLYSFVQN